MVSRRYMHTDNYFNRSEKYSATKLYSRAAKYDSVIQQGW
jgi:hypothetical protein